MLSSARTLATRAGTRSFTSSVGRSGPVKQVRGLDGLLKVAEAWCVLNVALEEGKTGFSETLEELSNAKHQFFPFIVSDSPVRPLPDSVNVSDCS